MMRSAHKGILVLGFFVLGATAAMGQQNFKQMVGPVAVGPVQQTSPLVVPYITWGGDMATFYGNGGLETAPGSIFDRQGLKLKLVPGDDFIQQTRDYLAGKTPFLRGTFRMIGMASEAIGADERTKGRVILQLTWSAGDHMVARSEVRRITDLKGKTVCLQQGGPHVGMLDDILKTARAEVKGPDGKPTLSPPLTWDDIKVVWAKDLTGSPDSPIEMFKKNTNIDACCVISPDMIGLTGGLQNIGSGAEGTVKGAHVLASTANLSKSIADVYVCRADFFRAHRDLVTKFVAGYLKACEEVTKLKEQFEEKGSPEYMKLLQLTQNIYGKDVIPTLEDDAHGLLMDCTFVFHPGNVEFFSGTGVTSFEGFQKSALDLAVSRGYARVRSEFFPSGLDYNASEFDILKIKEAPKVTVELTPGKLKDLLEGGGRDDTPYDFTIHFPPDEVETDWGAYGIQYEHVITSAERWGNAVFAVEGHADPTLVLYQLVKAGIELKILKRIGSPGNYKYFLNGKPVDLTSTEEIAKLIESGTFDGAKGANPRQTMQAAQNLSMERAQKVADSLGAYAAQKGLRFDPKRIQPFGFGVRFPVVPVPRDPAGMAANRRVEFRLVPVQAEAKAPTKDLFDL